MPGSALITKTEVEGQQKQKNYTRYLHSGGFLINGIPETAFLLRPVHTVRNPKQLTRGQLS